MKASWFDKIIRDSPLHRIIGNTASTEKSKRNDKVELSAGDECTEAQNSIRMRVQSKEKAEYISDVNASATKARRSWRDLGEKAEYVEPYEGEAQNKRYQTKEKSEYVSEVSTSAPEACTRWRGKAEHVEPDEGEAENKQDLWQKGAEKTSSTPSPSTPQGSWLLFPEKAEYVELDEGEAHNEQVKKGAEKTILSLSTLQGTWMLLLALTDESEAACEKFIYNGGLPHFMACYDENPSDESLLTLMMATLSNLSEYPRLRQVIMADEFIATFFHLLDAEFSISQAAASVLCNLATEGPKFWDVKNPSREMTLEKIDTIIDSWNPNVQLPFQYHSLKPFVNLVQTQGAPTCQKYALWILKNLLSDGVRGERYHDMLKKEGGESVLKKIIKNNVSPQYIKIEADNLMKKII